MPHATTKNLHIKILPAAEKGSMGSSDKQPLQPPPPPPRRHTKKHPTVVPEVEGEGGGRQFALDTV